MSSSHVAANPKLKLALLLGTALLAAVALLALSAPASAGSGGVNAGEETTRSGDGEKSSDSRKAKYRRLFKRSSNRDKRWARRTAECESGGDPDAIGGGGRYRGAFQFMRATWRAAPKSPGGDPIRFNYKTQAVVAIKLKRRDGAHHWPTCG